MITLDIFGQEPNKKQINEGVAENQDVDVSIVVGKLYDIIDQQEDAIKNADYDRQVKYATIVRNRAIEALNMIKLNPQAANSAWKYFQTGQQGVAEGFGSNYAEQLAQEVFNHNPNIKDENQVLNLGYNISKNDLGRKAQGIFRDEDFPSDFVSAYFWLQKQGVTEGSIGDELAQMAMKMNPRALVRKDGQTLQEPPKREVPQPAPVDVAKLQQAFDNLKEKYKQLGGDSWQYADRMMPRDIEAQQVYQQLNNLARQISNAKEQPVKEGRMGELAAEYDDYKNLSPREFFNIHKMTKQQWLEKNKALIQQRVAEANKKKDDDEGVGKVHDVALQRAISKSRAAFPTAQSGVQALMKSFAQDQEKDQDEFEKVRRADRRQDQLLAQISQLDKEQEKELQDLDKENNSLAQRLQQLQSVNDKLQQTLANMSGRKPKTKGATEPASVSIEPALSKPAAKDTHKPAKKPKSPPKSKSVGAISKQLTAPKKADPMAAMTQRIKHGDQSITNKLTGQQALDFDKTDDPYAHILDPSIPRRLTRLRDKDPANVIDVTPKRARDVTDFSKQNISNISSPTDVPDKTDTLRKTAYDVGMSENQKQDQEADYGDEYQDMVARVGQKAREQEKKKPVDIKDLARRLAAVKLRDEK